MILPVKVYWHLHLILDSQQKRVVTLFGKAPSIKAIISVSNTLAAQYKSESIYPKVRTVANWVSPHLVKCPRVIRPTQFNHPVRVGVVGLISKGKGQWTILKSLELWEKPLPIQLIIYGEPLQTETESWAKWQALIEKLNHNGWDIRYAGFEQDTLNIYDHLDVLVIPSLVPEAFGLTAIEAMAREVVVIANRSGALLEIIEPGKNGFLYEASQLDQLPKILERLASNQCDVPAMRAAGLETIRVHYQPQVQLEKLHQLVKGQVF